MPFITCDKVRHVRSIAWLFLNEICSKTNNFVGPTYFFVRLGFCHVIRRKWLAALTRKGGCACFLRLFPLPLHFSPVHSFAQFFGNRKILSHQTLSFYLNQHDFLRWVNCVVSEKMFMSFSFDIKFPLFCVLNIILSLIVIDIIGRNKSGDANLSFSELTAQGGVWHARSISKLRTFRKECSKISNYASIFGSFLPLTRDNSSYLNHVVACEFQSLNIRGIKTK